MKLPRSYIGCCLHFMHTSFHFLEKNKNTYNAHVYTKYIQLCFVNAK